MRHRAIAAIVAVAILVTATSHAARAGWTSGIAATTGTLRMATPSYAFVGTNAAAPAAWTVNYGLTLVSVSYPAITNTGATAVVLAGTVTVPAGLNLLSSVAVNACPTAYTGTANGSGPAGATCPAGEQVILAPTALNGAAVPVTRFTGSAATLAPGATVHLKSAIGGILVGTVYTINVTASLPTGGTNRTAG